LAQRWYSYVPICSRPLPYTIRSSRYRCDVISEPTSSVTGKASVFADAAASGGAVSWK
jgi:hypothetical protein